MTPRRADPRIGHFETSVWDFSSDSKYSPKTHYVDRWRLEKRDPQADVSEPKEPIVFYIDRNVPEKYRPTVREAILEWNKACEKVGFKDAIVVRQQDAEGSVDTFDARHSTVRWFVSTDGGFAIGPRMVDSRTGEILNAQVAIPEAWSRDHRTFVVEQAPFPSPSPSPSAAPGAEAYPMALRDGNFCSYASDALAEMQFGLDMLEERGEIQAGSAEAEAFVNASLKSAVMHEVGHALGLRHNFRASTVYPLAKLSDPTWSRENGLAGSVMDYNPINIAVNGEAQGAYFESTIGPYDYWAIEYAYRELPKETESAELAKIAGRGATDPLLAFSSDEEAFAGLDPDASRFDLGSDPLAYLQKRLLISQELWQRLQSKRLKPDESYAVLRRTFDAGFRQFTRSAALIAKYVGGVYYVRDFAGTSRLPLTPVPPAKQREALNIVATGIFSADSFRFKPEFLRSMGIDYLDIGLSNANRFTPDFSLRARVLSVQVGMMNTMLSDAVIARIQDSETKVSSADQVLTLPELFATLRGSIWSELATGGSIPAPRRDLQREHLRRVAGVLLRPSSASADAAALFREEAKTLSKEIKAAATRRGNRDAQTRAHLIESASILDEALKAPLVRQGV
jgi:hypothetical protein